MVLHLRLGVAVDPMILSIAYARLNMSGRFVPAMALMTASIEARHRGGFMSINSFVQQLASGIAAWSSGMILGQSATGRITHFSVTGFVSVTCALFCIYLFRFLAARPGGNEIGTVAKVAGSESWPT